MNLSEIGQNTQVCPKCRRKRSNLYIIDFEILPPIIGVSLSTCTCRVMTILFCREKIASREAKQSELPGDLPPEILTALTAQGFTQLYSHQVCTK